MTSLLQKIPTQRGTPRVYRIHPSLVGLHGRARRNARQRIYRRELKSLGLTVRGMKPVKRLRGSLGGLTGRARANAWLGLHRRANYALGRTARGTVRKRFTKPFTVTFP